MKGEAIIVTQSILGLYNSASSEPESLNTNKKSILCKGATTFYLVAKRFKRKVQGCAVVFNKGSPPSIVRYQFPSGRSYRTEIGIRLPGHRTSILPNILVFKARARRNVDRHFMAPHQESIQKEQKEKEKLTTPFRPHHRKRNGVIRRPVHHLVDRPSYENLLSRNGLRNNIKGDLHDKRTIAMANRRYFQAFRTPTCRFDTFPCRKGSQSGCVTPS